MTTETLLSFPPAAAHAWRDGLPHATFSASDPPGHQLGSGGGTAHLLVEAWKADDRGRTFRDWLQTSRKLIIHASGQSRRLPAYAAEGKILLPIPPLHSLTGQAPGQTLLDLQQSDYTHLLRHAPDCYCVVVACGDVLIREARAMPVFPEADVLIAGIPASAEEASNHGVMFCPADRPQDMAFFLQKPTVTRIHELAGKYAFTLDTGIWFLSADAVAVLLAKCGWDAETESFARGVSDPYELFDSFGPALGSQPAQCDAAIDRLTGRVLPLPNGRFYHFGTNSSVFSSIAQLSHPAESRRSFGHGPKEPHHDRVILNADASPPESVHPLWIENASVPSTWSLTGEHMITGVPPNTWSIRLPRGACVDMLGMRGRDGWVLRAYGFNDPFKGAVGNPKTVWLGTPVTDWLSRRGLTLDQTGIAPDTDIQNAPLFPVLPADTPQMPLLLQWMLTGGDDAALRACWLDAPRVSATEIVQQADLTSRIRQRDAHLRRLLSSQTPDTWAENCLQLDLEATANRINALAVAPPPPPLPGGSPLAVIHDAMFRSRLGGAPAGAGEAAFAGLRRLLVEDMALQPVKPARNILDDQIVWGRSPARLDLAGGWSDTPPYCIEHGGRVVNVAVDLNGQPPIQVFARVCEQPEIVLHSIDLGLTETIASYAELLTPSNLGGFSIARAALRLAGFDPMFHSSGGHPSLARQLETEFGGGIELSMLAAIPKGSGLGTSSILAATILGVLGDVCSHAWSHRDLFARTTVLEQILTSGGGWQDQVGGITAGVKLTTTHAELSQSHDIRWLPEKVLQDAILSGRALLYYTGLTRLARNILSEIVQGIFLNSRRTITTIADIALNADFTADAIQRNSPDAFREAIRRSWALNRTLDSGTCPPEVSAITSRVDAFGAAYKLLGAGGGGYLFILAPDVSAAAAITESLAKHPPNPRARFVDMAISQTGLQITRS